MDAESRARARPLDPHLLVSHSARMYRVARALCRSPHEAEDLVQDAGVSPSPATNTDQRPSQPPRPATSAREPSLIERAQQRDAPICYQCGMVMQRAGSCYLCTSCGTTSGCS